MLGRSRRLFTHAAGFSKRRVYIQQDEIASKLSVGFENARSVCTSRKLHQSATSSSTTSYNLVAFADGACRGNPGPGSCGALIIDSDTQRVVISRYRYLGDQETNNTTEYQGLLLALELAEELELKTLKICMDSELVIKQMRGEYRVKAAHLRALHATCRSRCQDFERIEFTHVPRNENADADRLANLALDIQAELDKDKQTKA
ncbi:hypothetical protein Poli38472_012995 [Pythium oligandrum]|uniref:RNase H type-1 domain-containing protein n=1 Tax=Pythium oligandrum TaxID=41045 RepID=A0A8K1CL67_PYTOL|nr:hypothetical protein Poli38472_012995 [Pythium oligandrum]|eukprot:TMW64373.1 hypothetical protein Poli38472_012995 [Pythium oligandrum]